MIRVTQIMGTLTEMQFTSTAVTGPNGTPKLVDVLRVYYKGPDGHIHGDDLPNGDWVVQNKALQFLAIWGYRPSDFDGQRYTCDDRVFIPLAPVDSGYALHQQAVARGDEVLSDCEWFSPSRHIEDTDAPHGPNDGGSDDDGGRPTREFAGEDADRGVNVVVE